MSNNEVKDFEKLTIYSQNRKKNTEDSNNDQERNYECDPNGGECAPIGACMPSIGCIPNECGPDEGIDAESIENTQSTPQP